MELQPGPVAGAACTYSIQGTAQRASAILVAGQQMVLCVETRDQFGNLTTVSATEGSLQAQANGPQGASQFALLSNSDQSGPENGGTVPIQQQLGATITAAGTYSLSVFIVHAGTGVRYDTL